MSPYNFVRQFRTPSSEGYAIMVGVERIGRADLHYGAEKVYANIVLERAFEEKDVGQIIDEIDIQLVETATVKREDLHVWVFEGAEVGFYTDNEPYADFDDEDDEDEDDERNFSSPIIPIENYTLPGIGSYSEDEVDDLLDDEDDDDLLEDEEDEEEEFKKEPVPAI